VTSQPLLRTRYRPPVRSVTRLRVRERPTTQRVIHRLDGRMVYTNGVRTPQGPTNLNPWDANGPRRAIPVPRVEPEDARAVGWSTPHLRPPYGGRRSRRRNAVPPTTTANQRGRCPPCSVPEDLRPSMAT
jgi:hypothetical protein